MRFDNPNEDTDKIRPKSVVPTKDRTATAIRTKLLMLFAMLILVIILMKEAGKPERWEWMGFDQQPQTNSEDSLVVELDTNAARNKQAGSAQSSKTDDEGSATSPRKTSTPNDSSKSIAILSDGQFEFAAQSDSDYPAAAQRFWATTFKKLGDKRQRKFLDLLKQMRTGKEILDADGLAEMRKILFLIKRQRDDFHQELFDQLALESEGSKEQTRIANELSASREIWDEKVFPAIDAATQGEDFTIAQQQAIFQLQNTLDQFTFQQVQDKSTIGWAGDTSAWLRLWEKVANAKPDGKISGAQKATRIELIGQPKSYRGQPVRIEGWVRSARIEKLKPNSKTGLDQYFELWVRPRESKLGPYNIFVKSLPDGFPTLSEQPTSTNVNVKLDGYFFKIRSYVAGDRSVENTPVILAPTVEVIPDIEFAATNQWQPSRGFLIGSFLFIPLFATAIAWFAFRTSKTRQYVPGKKTAEKINHSLTDLKDDPSVQTDREKIMALYDADSAEKSSEEQAID